MRGPCIRKDAEGRGSKSVRKDQVQTAAQGPSRTRGEVTEIQWCSTSGWQHFHLSNQTTHPLQFHWRSSLTASISTRPNVCLLPSAPTLSFHTSSLASSTYRPLFLQAHMLHAHTHTRALSLLLSHCLFVSLRRMSITAQGKEALIRGQECDASRAR